MPFDPNGPYISTSQTNLRNVYLLVISEFSLSSVTYTSLCRGLKCLLKIPYFIQDYPNETLCFEQVKNIALCSKKISQK